MWVRFPYWTDPNSTWSKTWIIRHILTNKKVRKYLIYRPLVVFDILISGMDGKDARWLCMLLMHGLVRASFMPTAEQRVLRDYCRSRLFYSRQQNKVQNRLWKILESNNIKFRSVISSICTRTAMSIIRLLSQGVTDKEQPPQMMSFEGFLLFLILKKWNGRDHTPLYFRTDYQRINIFKIIC